MPAQPTFTYQRNDPELRADLLRAGKLVHSFNSAPYEEDARKLDLLQELLGSMGSGCYIEHNFHCDLGYHIHVGDNFYAGYNCCLLDRAEIRIGDHCLLAPNVGLYTAGHHLQPLHRHLSGTASPIYIGDNVWIGGHAVVLGGVRIGNNSVIAAGSVVTTSVPDNVLYGGQPARLLKAIPPTS